MMVDPYLSPPAKDPVEPPELMAVQVRSGLADRLRVIVIARPETRQEFWQIVAEAGGADRFRVHAEPPLSICAFGDLDDCSMQLFPPPDAPGLLNELPAHDKM